MHGSPIEEVDFSHRLLVIIIERYLNRETVTKLSQDYRVCYQTIRKYLKDAKIPRLPFQRLSIISLDYEEVKRLYIQQRLSIEKTASMLNTSPYFVGRFLRDNGIRIRTPWESNTKISAQMLNEMAKRHQNGETLYDLASEYRVSESAIESRFKKTKIVFHWPKKILNKEEIMDLYHNQKIPTTKICVRVGVAKPTLLRFMRKNNIRIRTAGQSRTKLILTEELCNNIRKLYEVDKLSRETIAQSYGVTGMTIGKILQKLGIKSRERPEKYISRTKEMYDKIEKWYCEYCLTQRDIAEVLGVGEISVHSFMKETGIKTRGLSERLKTRRKIDFALLISQNNTSKKWRRNKKGAYNRVTCHQCGMSHTRPLSALSEKYHFCGNGCHRDYGLEHGLIPGRRPNMSEEKMLSLLKNISNEWRYVGDNSKIINGRNPDFWDGKTNLIELFGEPWHPQTDEVDKIEHYKKNGFNCIVVWWKELNEGVKTGALENRLRVWYTSLNS